ncbi:TPA: dTDP-4-amino-4,6-dideoxy-D-galactose acyltransferase [Serratia marcescens]|uniref:dTDP-4-amino-4,6-dideoxy-D-galactose acyltransferase n=1 Tax=Serratia TaxID=613 RepID=UPI00066566E6|nr:dTDP-4-amino-4,6-dideoxy-D-galactose acyltransferase [Serratia marcescens]MBH2669325.1 dTDP-4-amino-4,6-dideoxy-D-galactose acyltransferase [Serratia marcescens]MBH2674604.1 dTDP-4-amino-4,6-dideoxy-D-galactose acyltransferase [Serratia marcescens]MBH3057940.1 dTDP-4-amino-4,6-dideoxy-D-galactose acyltransferase [Serratia marcescens]MBH3205029.1 dTDP-4-amino-4,6-dideoxy-D-galactose acyltransferase [Serratia marcescens]MBH3302302.1 dTDP-4-amino-4,6-dideoxy-D-galactose acyltransferase [Serrat
MRVHASIEPLAWESEFFALNSAKLSFSPSAPALAKADVAAYALVQAKIPAQHVALADGLADLGFRLVEGEVDFVLDLDVGRADEPSHGTQAIRQATAADIPALRAAAAQVFSASRFRAPWYQPDDSGRFYALWIEKAVLGTFDRQCLLALDSQGRPEGFVSLRDIGESEARIGLLAAFPGEMGKGTGSRLMNAAKEACRHQGVQRLRVATQTGNIAALRLYQRQGAVIESTAYWLYRGRHDSI